MPRKNTIRSKSASGQTAIVKMARWSVDQAKGFATKRYTGKKAASNIARDLTMLRGLLNTEEKHTDIKTTATALVQGSGGEWYNVPTCAQGVTGETRTGDSVKVVRVDAIFRFTYGSGTSNTYTSQEFKWWLVQYLKTPSASGTVAPNTSEFLDTDPDGNYTPLSLHATDTMENFRVLQCGLVHVPIDYTVAAQNTIGTRIVEISHDCNIHQTYNTATSTGICDNMMFVVMVAMNPLNTAGVSTVELTVRSFFIDN